MRRILPFILVFVLIFTLSFNGHAASTDSQIDFLEYTSIDSDNYFYFNSSVTYEVSVPFTRNVSYVDILFWASVKDENLISVSWGTSSLTSLTVDYIGDNMFRAYGNVPSRAARNFSLSFASSSSSDIYVNLYSLTGGPNNLDFFKETGHVFVSYPIREQVFMEDADTPASVTYNFNASVCNVYFATYDWHLYDRVDFNIYLSVTDIANILVNIDGTPVPFTISGPTIYDQSLYDRSSFYITVSCDVSNLEYSSRPLDVFIKAITLSDPHDVLDVVCRLDSVYGFLDITPDPDIYWLRNISNLISTGFNNVKSWIQSQTNAIKSEFSSLSTLLKKLFGFDDKSHEVASQKQEEINVSINNQLVGAVEDWNSNIDVVGTGYDMAFSKTSPSLTWLSSLANGIFNGMGWFGNIYFLVGLISVFMLVLSKSGIASKIGSISRRKGD